MSKTKTCEWRSPARSATAEQTNHMEYHQVTSGKFIVASTAVAE